MDVTKINELGWESRTALSDGIRKTIDGYTHEFVAVDGKGKTVKLKI